MVTVIFDGIRDSWPGRYGDQDGDRPIRTPHQAHQNEQLIGTNRRIEIKCLGGAIDEKANISREIGRRIRFALTHLKQYGRQLYNQLTTLLTLKVNMFKALR